MSTTTDSHNLSTPPPTDLRHMTSQPALLSPSQFSTSTSPARQTQPLSSLSPGSSRPGSRSPASIPSSPTSIHSSSSAIFERDIEQLPSASPPPHSTTHHAPNPHRTPRSKATEQIEQSVPSVLAEAASALAASSDSSDISVIAPAPGPAPLSFSQAGSVGSRSPRVRSRTPSPSPPSRKASLPVSPGASSSGTPARPSIATRRTSTGPLPPGAFGVSPTTPTTYLAPSGQSASPIPSPPTATSALPPPIPDAPSTSSVHTSSAHQKRLSFVSYSDLLSSTPITSLPLSSLTAPHSAAPPPHLPAVSAAATVSSPSPSVGAPSRPLSTYSISTTGMSGGGGRGGGLGEEQQGVGKRLKDDIGGEWEREGFGKGLEERLEELMVGKA